MKTIRIVQLVLAVPSVFLPALSRAQSYPPVWSSTASYAAGDLVQYGGNWYRAIKALSAHGPYPSNGYGDWEMNYIRSNTTIMIGVGQQFSSLQDAWAFILEARVADGAYLHLAISTAHGELLDTFTGQFSLDHQSGSKISIIGDNNSKIFLGGSAGFPGNGFTLDTGHDLALLSGVTVLGQGLNAGGTGINVTGGASISCVGVQVTLFDIGVAASQNANVEMDGTSGTPLSAGYGIYAITNASVTLIGFSCMDVPTGAILFASSGGTISAEDCTLNGESSANTVGVNAVAGGSIDVSSSSIKDFAIAMKAFDHSFINAEDVVIGGNQTDMSAIQNAVINASGVSSPNVGVDSGTGSYIYGYSI